MENIIITGGDGFIGSHVVSLFVTKYPEYRKQSLRAVLRTLKMYTFAPNFKFVPLNKLVTHLIHMHISGLYKDVTSQNRILEISKDLYQKTAKKENVLLEKFGFNTSGNVDYNYFQKVVGAIGCRGRLTIEKNRVKDAMERTKDYRNKLAHGNWSFSVAGSMLTLSQIEEDYQRIYDYLNQSLHNLESFLDNKKYLK